MHKLAKAVAPDATRRVFKKRSVLLYQGEVPQMASVIKNGLVKMYSINNWGEEQIIAFYGPDDFFPASWIFRKSPTSLYYFETLTNCEILTLPRDALSQIINKAEFLPQALDYFIGGHTELLMRLTALEQSRAREKVMFTLSYLLFRYGKQMRSGLYTIDFPLTHKIIASLIGLTRETTSNEISRLKKQKILRNKLSTYIIDKQKLEQALGEDSFRDINL